jgi:ABC-type transport system involved in multi-copper enzyme maturation permease subunit
VSAVAPKKVSSTLVVALMAVFAALFVLLFNMAMKGSSLSILGSTNAVVCVVLFLRILNKVNHYLAQRFLQTSYHQDETEDVNSLVYTFNVAGNICGTLTAATIIATLM